MNQENYISTAIDLALAWNVPDEDFAQAVNDQARLMAGINPDELLEAYAEYH